MKAYVLTILLGTTSRNGLQKKNEWDRRSKVHGVHPYQTKDWAQMID